MMKPSVGRIVHFYDHSLSPRANNGIGAGPYPAVIVQVLPNGTAVDPVTQQPKPTFGEDSACNIFVMRPISERETGTSPNEDNVIQRSNDVEWREGRYFEEPPRV